VAERAAVAVVEAARVVREAVAVAAALVEAELTTGIADAEAVLVRSRAIVEEGPSSRRN
jgi:hypothetical protein